MRWAVRPPSEVLPSVGVREAGVLEFFAAFRREARVRRSCGGVDSLFRVDEGRETSPDSFRAGRGILARRLRRRGYWLFRRRESIDLDEQIG